MESEKPAAVTEKVAINGTGSGTGNGTENGFKNGTKNGTEKGTKIESEINTGKENSVNKQEVLLKSEVENSNNISAGDR